MTAPPPDKEAELQKTREKFVQESLLDPKKQRFGLFSYSTLAIGDDSIGRKTKPRRGEDGAVVIEPKNFYTKRLRKGKTADVYFSKPLFHTIGDPYVKKTPKPEVPAELSEEPPFKPPGAFDPGYSPFPHEASETFKKKNYRDADGAVILEAKNILAIPPKKGAAGSTPNLTFSKVPAITNEPYERKRQLQREEQLRNKNLNKHEREFRGISHGYRNFANNVLTYGKTEMPPRSPPRPISVPVVEHDRPFRPANPAKKGITDMSIGKFPEYKTGADGKKPPRPITDERKWK